MAGMATLAEILESEQIISQFFEHSQVGLAVLDSGLRYRMLNPYLAASHNTPAACHLGRHIQEILGSTASQVELVVQEVLTTGRSVVNCEIKGALPTKPEGAHWIANYFPIADSIGRVYQVGAVVVELGKNVDLRHAPNAGTTLLRSWKDIAQYVGTSTKTVQRWEHAHEFPIRRVDARKGAVVFGVRVEIDEWILTREREPKRT
jgi:predicted DNA-binding transcriptional regulator AlpA